MPNIKYPIVFWQDYYGNFTVRTLSGLEGVAVAADLRDAKNYLEKFLSWRHKKTSCDSLREFLNPTLGTLRVKLRGRYMENGEYFPNPTVSLVQMQYVLGESSEGTFRCVFPKLGTSFSCNRAGMVKSLGEEYIKEFFANRHPNQIARAVSISPIEIDYVNVRVDYNKHEQANSAWTETLSQVAINLGSRNAFNSFETAWNRTNLVKRLAMLLDERSKNILLVGKAGVGKTTVLAEAVKSLKKAKKRLQKNATDDEEGALEEPTGDCWLTNASRLISGMQYLGQWEKRCEDIVTELAETRGILCIENLLDLIMTDREPSSSIAAFFRNFLLSNELRMVAEASPRELETIRRLLPGFDSLFELVDVRQMNESDSIEVLASIAKVFEQNQKLQTTRAAASLAVQLYRRFLPYSPFPGKCVGFWRRLNKRMIQEAKANDTAPRLQVDDVVLAFSREMGLPEFLIRDEMLLTTSEVREFFAAQIIGQPIACDAMTQLIMRIKAAMNDPGRPLGVYLFCGPTGVGKTEMAKTLSRYLFGAKANSGGTPSSVASELEALRSSLIRLDMSEYSGVGSAQRLLTKPDGTTSELVEQIRLNPFSVVLLDEIEKAAFEVFDALMNVFDEGYMLDPLGRETNFCSSVFVLTSNLGAQTADSIGFESQSTDLYAREVRRFFRPEFFNRLDGVLNFNHLTMRDIERITLLDVQKVAQREGLEKRNIRLSCSDKVITWLANRGYDRRLGARPLQRTIEAHIVTPIAHYLAENPQAKNQELRLVLANDRVVLE
ncbi:MAG TPA: AAA family ATPase [Pirellulaceae bacterium]|nr:AAA family ATPase [Pirellulaceae bacterium]HMO90824.1 AAA family ATPase [Pirellulaceae bacterium]HMP68075.1 AAA family ATPase [Pirellulaceae bacterium]